jgi:predicted lipid-binding transport protein (Tim44 family)
MLLFELPRDPQHTPVAAPARPHAPARHRATLFGGCLLAVLAGLALGDPAPRLAADPELAFLLRGMAGIKALLLLGAVSLLAWRFARPVPARTAAVYIGGAAVMAGATALIWQLTALPLAAVAFHAAEIAVLVAAWRDLR